MQLTKCLCNCGVRVKVLSSFNVWSRGSDTFSKGHHCINTNVMFLNEVIHEHERWI